MGIHFARTELPTDFDFTCFAWVHSSGVFREFSASHVLAAGTRQGVAVILTEGKNGLQRCALLCGHNFPITDIRFDGSLNLILSISQEGSLCGWSSADGSCVFHNRTFAPIGDYRIVLWPANPDCLCVWCIGQSAWLVNLRTFERVLVVSDYALQSFSAISLHSSLVVRGHIAVCVSVSMLRTYKILDGLTPLLAIPKGPFDRYIASEHGLVRCSGSKWSILQPDTGTVLLSGELPGDVAGVEWPSPALLCFATYTAEFHLVRLTKSSPPKVSSASNIAIDGRGLLGRFAVDEALGVAFSPTSSTILRVDSNHTVATSRASGHRRLHFVPDAHGRCVIEVRDDGSVFQYNWMTDELSELRQFDRRCTAFWARPLSETTAPLQFVAGFDNGRVSFMDGAHACARQVFALTARIIAFVEPPFRLQGRGTLLAIGSNGSCCLFNWTEPTVVFDGWRTRIVSISYIDGAQVLVVGHEDGAYIVHSLSGDVRFVLTEIPKGAVEFWTASPRFLFDSTFVTSQLSFRTAALFVLVIDVEAIQKATWRHFLMRILSDDEGPYSFLFLGKDLVPTLFYSPFRLNNRRIGAASPFIAGIHHVQRQIVARILGLETDVNTEVSVDFLPVLTQLMGVNDVMIEEICVGCAVRLLPKITLEKCQELVRPCITPTRRDPSDEFLLAILLAAHPNAIPREYQRHVFAFLKRMTEVKGPRAVMALAILLHGISVWLNHSLTAKDLYLIIIRGILRQKHADFLGELFCQLACVEADALLEVFPDVVAQLVAENQQLDENLKILFDLYSRVADSQRKLFGGSISARIARAFHDLPRFGVLISDVLCCHSRMFDFVACENDVVVIGNPNGSVNGYKERKLLFEERIADGNIGTVDIGPGCRYAAAVCVEEKTAFLLRVLEKAGFKWQKSRVASNRTIEPGGGKMQIIWLGDDNFDVLIV
jgi:hypothetical protein